MTEAGQADEPTWLSPLILRAVHADQLRQHGGRAGLRDEGRLESAVERPRNRWRYGDDPDMAELAAAYAHGIVSNHPFVDGNKRTALMAAFVFLALNGRDLRAPEPEAVAALLDLSSGDLPEKAFAEWLRRHTGSA